MIILLASTFFTSSLIINTSFFKIKEVAMKFPGEISKNPSLVTKRTWKKMRSKLFGELRGEAKGCGKKMREKERVKKGEKESISGWTRKMADLSLYYNAKVFTRGLRVERTR